MSNIMPNEFKARMVMIELNQSTLAEKLGISVRTVNRWLNETTIPTIAIYALIGLEAEYDVFKSEGKDTSNWWMN